MLIMLYAHAQRTGDISLLVQHVWKYILSRFSCYSTGTQYNLLRGWADYLVNNSLIPGNQ